METDKGTQESVPYFVNDSSQDSKMVTSSKVLNDSSFLNNLPEEDNNLTTSKTYCSNYQKMFSREPVSENDVKIEKRQSSENETWQNKSKEPLNIQAKHDKYFDEQFMINVLKDNNLWSSLDDTKVKVARFLDSNSFSDDNAMPPDDYCYSESIDAKSTRFQHVQNMPRMNWNFDLKILEGDKIIPYVSSYHMLYRSAVCRSDKDILTDFMGNYKIPDTCAETRSDGPLSEDVTLDTTPKRSKTSTAESLNNSLTSSPAIKASVMDSWATGDFPSDADSSKTFASNVREHTFGNESQSVGSTSGLHASTSTFQTTNTPLCGSVTGFEKTATSHYACTFSLSSDHINESVMKNTKIKRKSKRKAENTTDMYLPLIKWRPTTSKPVNPVQVPKQPDQRTLSPQQWGATSPNADDVAKPVIQAPPAPRKRGLCIEVDTYNTSNSNRSYDADFTTESLTRRKARRRLFVDANRCSSTKDEDEDETFIPGILKKLFSC